jgi:hypothetical protein
MPKKNLENPWEALADIFREVSWTVKICLFLGIAAGLLVPPLFGLDYTALRLRGMVCTIFGLIILGAFVGLAVGVGVEFIIGRISPRDDDPPKKKRR